MIERYDGIRIRTCSDGSCGACNFCRWRDSVAVMEYIHSSATQELKEARSYIILLRNALDQLYSEAKDTDLSIAAIRLVEGAMSSTEHIVNGGEP